MRHLANQQFYVVSAKEIGKNIVIMRPWSLSIVWNPKCVLHVEASLILPLLLSVFLLQKKVSLTVTKSQ